MIILKIGGGEGIDPCSVVPDVARIAEQMPMVIVHGGSHQTNVLSRKLGHPPVTVTSPSGHTSRRTDAETMEMFTMVYCGLINTRLVAALQAAGRNAVGLSGADGALLRGRRKKAIRSLEKGRVRIIRDDYTGTVDSVNTALLNTLLNNGCLPVITPPALSEDNELINVDGDRIAARIAAALKAEALIYLSNVPGLLRNLDDPASVIHHIPAASASTFQQFARGRMKNKLLGATEARADGVARIVIADARVENPVSAALDGRGTVLS